MSTGERNRNYSRTVLRIGIILALFIVYYAVMSFAATKKTSLKYSSGYYKSDEDDNTDTGLSSDSAYLALLKERSFLQSRLIMAKSDSIYLSVNLTDSIVMLEISGVTVHSSGISRISRSSILESNNNLSIFNLLSEPLIISAYYSSIPREPLMLKIAPKDTSEYQPDIVPDTSDVEPVNFILHTDKGIVIQVYQENNLAKSDGYAQFFFDLSHRFRTFLKAFKSIMVIKIPDYEPFIRIEIPRDDAKIIFRALPENGEIGVFL